MEIYAFADEASPSLAGQIRALLDNRLCGIELRNVDGVNVSALSKSAVREIRRRLDAAGLSVWSIGSPVGKVGITDDFKPQTELLQRTLEIADCLGAKNLRLFSFYIPASAHDAWRDAVMERLSRFVELAQGSGVTLCHENEKGIFGDTAARCAEIHRMLPEIRAVFDPANFVQCGEDTEKCWELLRPYIEYIHIKDAVSHDKENVLCGTGEGKIKALLTRAIRDEGYEGFLTLEPHLVLFASLQSLETEDAANIIKKNKAKDGAEGYAMQYHALREILDAI